ncbi:MAG: hypothetical protein ACFE0S_05240 [Rhodospirillales bacterium]
MRIAAFTVLTIVTLCAVADAARAAVYACEVKEVRRLGPGGVPESDARTAATLRQYPRFTFDDRTGRLAGLRDEWVLSLLQKAVAQNALLAVSIHKGIGNTGLRLLKIDTFRQGEMPFLWVSDDEISTGVCTVGGD